MLRKEGINSHATNQRASTGWWTVVQSEVISHRLPSLSPLIKFFNCFVEYSYQFLERVCMQQSFDRQGERAGLPKLPEVRNIVKTASVAPALIAAGSLMESIERFPIGGAVVTAAYLAYLGHNIIVARSSKLHD